MSRPRVAIFDFACCEGCQLQIVNMESDLLHLLGLVEPVEWREAISDQSEEYDIAIVEGSITRPHDEERLREIRARARILIALGACATLGGVNKLRNLTPVGEARNIVYGEAAEMRHLESGAVKALHEVVKVDYRVEGCPIDATELAYVIRCLLVGKTPVIPDHPVCFECKLKENVCRFDCGEICLGPITRAGCDARCPSNGFWCFGCRGRVSDANLAAARQVIGRYGKSMADLEDKMLLFGTGATAKES